MNFFEFPPNIQAAFEGKKTLYKPESFFTLKQVHADQIYILRSFEDISAYRNQPGDAIISTVANVKIAIKTADCVPILIAHPQFVAAIHSGWRGTKLAILQKCIQKIKKEFSNSVQALKIAIGPSIGADCYEVGEEVACEFNESYVSPQTNGKYLLNLQQANRDLALEEGVDPKQIYLSEECTLCKPQKYYSYRYETKKGLMKEGRNYSWISLI